MSLLLDVIKLEKIERRLFEMKKITLIGKYPQNGLLLQVLAEKDLLKDCFNYHIIEPQRGGIYVRKLESKLENADPKQAIESADMLLAFGPLSKELENLTEAGKVFSFEDYTNTRRKLIDNSSIVLPFFKSWFSDILGVIRRLSLTGYNFYLGAEQEELDNLLAMTKFRNPNAPVSIFLSFNDEQNISPEQIFDNLLHFLRERVPLSEFCTQFAEAYIKSQKKNLHLLQYKKEDGYIAYGKVFLSCSRTVQLLTKPQYQFLEVLNSGNTDRIGQISRLELEEIASIWIQEENKAQRFETLLSTNLARIENYNDVIVSFIGSHRCNMKCKYCFSDHTSEALSTMSENDMLEIADMLTHDRHNLNLHVDNNLAGEPIMDEKAVEMRHNTMIAYHKTRGIRASFGLLTNGTLLKPKHLNWLRCHLPYLGFSLDGDRQTHDKIRRDAAGNPTYSRTVRGIKMIQNAGWPVETGVSTVISKYNLDISSLQAHIRDELSVPNIVMKPVRASADSDFALTYDDLEQLKGCYADFFDYLQEQGRQRNLKPLFTVLQPLDYAGRFFLRVFSADRVIVKRCGSGEHIFSVADNGKVYPCDSFNGITSMEIANIEEGIHNRPNYRVPFVMEEKAEFGCNKCWARYLCGGICQYVQYLNHYKLNDVIRFECGFARFLIEASIYFWQEARETWDADLLCQVEERICNIGFSPMSDKDSFTYAPC